MHEPLLHCLLAGIALFVVYRAFNPVVAGPERTTSITFTDDDLRQLTAAWLAQGRPQPTLAQMRRLVETKVGEEILFREALALGLDNNDTIVKRRLAQKMAFLAEDLSGIDDPSHDELKAWFEKRAERFAASPRASFRHLYFCPDRRGARARDDALRSLEKLHGQPAGSRVAARLADPFMFQAYYADRSLEQVASVFGSAFAQSLFGLEHGSWQGPIESGYGWHLVWIDAIESKRVPAFEKVEPEVKREWMVDLRAERKRKVYESIRARYAVNLPEIVAAPSTVAEKRP